jgi:hypothetical protein
MQPSKLMTRVRFPSPAPTPVQVDMLEGGQVHTSDFLEGPNREFEKSKKGPPPFGFDSLQQRLL